jgi:predicted transcriptional regulator
MPAIKTAISIEKALFDQAEELALEMKVSRSRLVSLALDQFVRKHEQQDMIRRINEACGGFPDQEEKDFLRLANASAAKLTEDDPW